MSYKKLQIDGDIESLSPFQFNDIYFAFKEVVKIRKNIKQPLFLYEGQYLNVTIRVTKRGVYHASWSK